MKNKGKVIVGLSGGVDSSVAAYLLKKEGYEVTGVTMTIWDGKPGTASTGKHSCYGPDEAEEVREARELAEMLDIPYRVFDCSGRYKSLVLDYFRQEYLSGRTPNPCVKCNQLIKFGMLPDLASEEGIEFDFFATGHYARVEKDHSNGRFFLRKAADLKKDQTYFIYRLSQQQLSRLILPLGELTKQDVRRLAAEINIPLSEREESQDFYSGDYKELLETSDKPGNIVMTDGKVVGKHSGIWNYTIGQRKGLGIAWSEPLYVAELRAETNEVVVGVRNEIMNSSFLVEDLNWMAVPGISGETDVMARIRSAQGERGAVAEPWNDGLVKVTFNAPNDGITPGQSAVFYNDGIVLGGGVIKSVIKNNH